MQEVSSDDPMVGTDKSSMLANVDYRTAPASRSGISHLPVHLSKNGVGIIVE
jgi:hypothetical protein